MDCRMWTLLRLTISLLLLPVAAAQTVVPAQAAATDVDAAQSPAPFTLRVKARAVITDVLVLDKKDRPVTGLPQSAFHLTDDGRAQHLAFFQEHTGDTTPALETLPQGTFSSDTSHLPGVLNILVIDTVFLALEDQMFLSYQLDRFIQALPANQPIAVYLRSGQHAVQVQGMTADHTLLLKAVHHSLPRISHPLESSYQVVEVLHQIAGDLGRVPGRKNVIWLTGAIVPPFTVAQLESGQLEAGLRIAYDELQAARVAVYPIDARGLTILGSFSSVQAHWLMDEIAESTGGLPTYNNNGIALAVGQVVARASDFYELSYTPASLAFDGRWHSVRVKVDGPYKVSYRHGFYADDSQKLLPGGTRTRLGVLGNTYEEKAEDAVRPIVFTARVTPQPAQQAQAGQPPLLAGRARYQIDFAVSPAVFKRSLQDGKSELRLRLAILAMDGYGTLLTSRAIEHDVYVHEDRLRENPDAKIPVTEFIDLKPGNNYLYLIAWDPQNSRAGTLTVPVEVPKIAKLTQSPK